MPPHSKSPRAVSVANHPPLPDNTPELPPMIPALFLIPLVALFRIFMAWQPVDGALHSWLPGFTPLAAVALCAGVYLPRRLALAIPLGILLLSDAIIDAHYGAYSFFALPTLAHYALLALIGLGGRMLRCYSLRLPGFGSVLVATLAGSTFFYAVSNALVWLGSPDYPQTAAGLLQALTTGLPQFSPPSYVFFRNELVSDALYSMVFVACVRLTLPRGERIRSSASAGSGLDATLADARHRG